MEFSITNVEEITIIKNVEKEWNVNNSYEIKEALIEFIEREKPYKIVFNLENLDLLDDYGYNTLSSIIFFSIFSTNIPFVFIIKNESLIKSFKHFSFEHFQTEQEAIESINKITKREKKKSNIRIIENDDPTIINLYKTPISTIIEKSMYTVIKIETPYPYVHDFKAFKDLINFIIGKHPDLVLINYEILDMESLSDPGIALMARLVSTMIKNGILCVMVGPDRLFQGHYGTCFQKEEEAIEHIERKFQEGIIWSDDYTIIKTEDYFMLRNIYSLVDFEHQKTVEKCIDNYIESSLIHKIILNLENIGDIKDKETVIINRMLQKAKKKDIILTLVLNEYQVKQIQNSLSNEDISYYLTEEEALEYLNRI
ncbi:MAG: hypothetical protein KDK90_26470 [Leptospiraceae bacterium]|nr:hypothetical protein [Leptospiraceae bacterium]